MRMKFLMATLITTTLTACGHHHRSPERKLAHVESRISDELDLDASQEAKLREVTQAMHRVMGGSKADKKAMREEFQDMIRAPKMDMARMKSLMAKKEAMMARKKEAFYREVYPKLAVFHDSLSTEQREKAASCMEKHGKRHKMMW